MFPYGFTFDTMFVVILLYLVRGRGPGSHTCFHFPQLLPHCLLKRFSFCHQIALGSSLKKINCSISYEFIFGCSYSISSISFSFHQARNTFVCCYFKVSHEIKRRGSQGFALCKLCLAELEFPQNFQNHLVNFNPKRQLGFERDFTECVDQVWENCIFTVASPFL